MKSMQKDSRRKARKAALILKFVGGVGLATIASRVSLLPSFPPIEQQVLCDSSVICPGEELIYEVSWMSAKLGQIKIKTLETKTEKGNIIHNAVAYIDSYDIPFADLHAVEYTKMTPQFYSRGFHAMEKKDDKWRVDKSYFDLKHDRIVIEKYEQATKTSPKIGTSKYDTLRVKEDDIVDGLSLLFFARRIARIQQEQTLRVPSVVYGKLGSTVFSTGGSLEYQEIEALDDQEVRTRLLKGKAEFEGMFGMTGDFKGWFTDDAASVPVRGELKVILGSVTVELVKWNRRGWSLPIAARD